MRGTSERAPKSIKSQYEQIPEPIHNVISLAFNAVCLKENMQLLRGKFWKRTVLLPREKGATAEKAWTRHFRRLLGCSVADNGSACAIQQGGWCSLVAAL